MKKILFICYGNICRSPTAEYIMRDMLKKAGMDGEVYVSSAATSDEEIGNGVYPPMKKLLAAHGIENAEVTAVDKGALDCTIRARVDAAIYRAAKSDAYQWEVE